MTTLPRYGQRPGVPLLIFAALFLELVLFANLVWSFKLVWTVKIRIRDRLSFQLHRHVVLLSPAGVGVGLRARGQVTLSLLALQLTRAYLAAQQLKALL